MTEVQFGRACDAARRRFWDAYERAPAAAWRQETDRAGAVYDAEIAALTDRRMATLAGRCGR